MKINEIADKIYTYCIYAMDYDLMGLTFDESSLLAAFKNNKDDLVTYSKSEYILLVNTLRASVLKMYDENKLICEQTIDADDIIKQMSKRNAQSEMEESAKFIDYLNQELDYTYFKKIVSL